MRNLIAILVGLHVSLSFNADIESSVLTPGTVEQSLYQKWGVIKVSRFPYQKITNRMWNQKRKDKGRVEQYSEFGIKTGPFRVWLKNEMYPGLAMSRSLGDLIASSVEVIPEPEIIEYFVNTNTKYVMLASDGIWEFLSNEAVMKISNQHYEKNDAIGLCDDIVAEATRHWEKEDVVIDDITVVVVFF